jgi:integrase
LAWSTFTACGVVGEPGLEPGTSRKCVTPSGYAVNGTWLTKHFQQLLDDAGLPRMHFHDLRHGAASLLADAGVHPRIAQGLLRHVTSKTTQDVYTHTTAAQERAAADALDGAIGHD